MFNMLEEGGLKEEPVTLDRAVFIEAFENGKSNDHSILLKAKDGDRKHLKLKTNAFFDDPGAIDGSLESVKRFFEQYQQHTTQEKASGIDCLYRYKFDLPSHESAEGAQIKVYLDSMKLLLRAMKLCAV